MLKKQSKSKMRDSICISYISGIHLNTDIAVLSEHFSKGLCKWDKCRVQMIEKIKGTSSKDSSAKS